MNIALERLIPDDWSPEQALAAFELAQAMTELIWEHYQLDIQALLCGESQHCNNDQLDLPFDDVIPF